MKIKDILSITLKIIGLIAFWKAIQTFGAVITGIGMFSTLFASNSHLHSSFMFAIGLAMILNFLLPLLVVILFLFRTEKVLSIIQIKEHDNVDLNLNKLVFYHMIIIVLGSMVIMHGTGNFLTYKYNTDTKTEHKTNTVSAKDEAPKTTKGENVTVTNSKSKNVNYFALIEIILGIILLAKATDIAKKTESVFDSKTTNKLTEETDN